MNRAFLAIVAIGVAACGGGPWARVRAARDAIAERHWAPPSDERLADAAVRAMVAELDPHSVYLSPEELRWFEEDVRGSYGGIGVEVVPEGELWRVVVVAPGGPAERGGLAVGDRIARVDGLIPGKTPRLELLRVLRGPIGGKVSLLVRKGAEAGASPVEVVLSRARVASQSVVAAEPLVDADGVAVVAIRQFQEATREAFLRVEERLLAGGALRGLVVDLRGNPGGLVESAHAIADRWIDEGPTHAMHFRGDVLRAVLATPGAPLGRVPTVVVVDAATASAAELLAAALRERVGARLVGERTFGKGTVQILEHLQGGGAVDVTVGEYRTACGASIQARGLTPDLVFAGDADRKVEREEDLPRVLRIDAPHEPPVAARVDPLVSIVRPREPHAADAALARARAEVLAITREGRTPTRRACPP